MTLSVSVSAAGESLEQAQTAIHRTGNASVSAYISDYAGID